MKKHSDTPKARDYNPTQKDVVFEPIFTQEVCMQVLKEMGVKYTVCKMDVKKQCIALAREFNCPIISYDIEYCFSGVPYILSNTLSVNESSSEIKSRLFRLNNFLDKYSVTKEKLVYFILLRDETMFPEGTFHHFFTCSDIRLSHYQRTICLLKWLSRQPSRFIIVKTVFQFIDENNEKIFLEKENEARSLIDPQIDVGVPVKYLKNDKYKKEPGDNGFEYDVAAGWVPRQYINLCIDKFIKYGSTIQDPDSRNAFFITLDIVRFVYSMTTYKEYNEFTVYDNDADSHIIKVDRDKDVKINWTSDFKLIHKDQFTHFFTKKSFDPYLKLVPDDAKLLFIALTYCAVKNDRFTDNEVFSILLSYVILNNASDIYTEDATDELSSEDNPVEELNIITSTDSLMATAVLSKYFEITDEKLLEIFDRKILHPLIEFQYCLQHLNFLNTFCRDPYKPTIYTAAYNPEIVERNKYETWEKNDVFKANNIFENENFSMVLPPPNVTGKLHLGHALACTVQDVIVRRQRALGKNVLWIPGTDHAGIATQGVVEKHLQANKNITRHDLGREEFIQEVWKWNDKHGKTITNQLRTLGNSLDWSRQVFTMNTDHSHAVNTAFIHLFEKGLIYRQKALVNWCTSLKSTVSDIEVENLSIDEPKDIILPGYDKPVKFGQIYDIAYKIFDSNEEIVVSTTMPETILGDMAIAVHPQDARYKHLHEKRAIHPFRNIYQTIPIIFDEFVDMNFGTGAVKITPAHSKVDYEIAKRHHLSMLQVINEDGTMENSGIFNTLKRYDCRESIVERLGEMGLLKKATPHKMLLPICSRSGDVIDHLPKEQWFLSCSNMNKKAAEMIKGGDLKIVPDKYVKYWLDWMANDRDWCISRQLWWGHQIPAYKCSANWDVIWVAAHNECSAKRIASKHLRTHPDEIVAQRDTDVLDTWFSSGIYPFAALGWPHNTLDFKQFYPLNLLVTGHDILGFWVHRMVILGLELTRKLPFNNVLLHGVVCDTKGAKMSKSRGNVIDPIDVINGISMSGLKEKAEKSHKSGILSKEELNKALAYHKSNFSNTNGIPECGVDALRFTLLTQDIKSHFINFDVAYCFSNKLFCNKIWQSIKYLKMSLAKLQSTENEITINDLSHFDKWILSRLADTVKNVNNAMDNYDFHLATRALRTMIYNDFCDVYLEATKPGFDNSDYKVGYSHAHTLSAVLNTSLRCLSPFMIYLTDELIPKIPDFETNIIINFDDENRKVYLYPNYADFKVWHNESLENNIRKLLNIVNLVRELKGLYDISNNPRPVIRIKTENENLRTHIKENKAVILNLCRCNEIITDSESDKNFARGVLDEQTEIGVELPGSDVEKNLKAAKAKLERRVKKLEESVSKLEENVSSSQYLTKVPHWNQIVDREKLQTKKRELEELKNSFRI
ncbi:hypothetical protein K1T71_013844 [Dendrolimus kikuchii]|uniref:Uncharacterized protein n=1 Tax=Dendrolimus kikuchii TaxID=765133 RepID=A0ACC1CG42_9NEOP|nr:hypothetical protein K1T71_013844 [Dendrolimus kikuchii]